MRLNNTRLIKYIINIVNYNIIIIKKTIKIIINNIYNNLKNTISIVNIIIS